ncbi:MAG: hypothetical protein K5649_03880 [Lachnospiraceae bacterium]|nr:hypothetical protein [Lachnospiraceae bacterium]
MLACLLACILLFTSGCGTKQAGDEATDGWGETQSLSVATEWAGLDFDAPAESFQLDDGTQITLTTYRYRKGIVEALYRGEDYELVLRKSDALQGLTLAEDQNDYDQEWEETIGTKSVHCLGDGVHANVTFFDEGGDHFSITCHIGASDRGLNADELTAFLTP